MAGLCAGAGGLEMAVAQVTGAVPLWLAENDPYASLVLAERFPGVPNIGDITTADWSSLPRVDVLAAGFPCTDISDAGPRTGITGPRSVVWNNVAEAVSVLRPSLVLLENVAAIRGRGLDTVVSDLGRHGYGVRWVCVYASDVGAPHPRRRWFAVAVPAADGLPLDGWDRVRKPMPMHGVFTGGSVRAAERPAVARDAGSFLLPTPTTADGSGGPGKSLKRKGGMNLRTVATLLPTPKASDGPHGGPSQRDAAGNFYLPGVAAHLLPTPCVADGTGGRRHRSGSRSGELLLPGVAEAVDHSWVCTDGRDFGPAVRHWEGVLQQGAPHPLVPGTRSLAPALPEWMMGWPPGHATATHTPVPRSQQLRIIGNGVVPRQAAYAYEWLFELWRKDL